MLAVIFGFGLLVVGLLITVVGSIWFLVETFRVSILWGVATLLVPFTPLVFLFRHSGRAWRPFGMTVVGLVFEAAAYLLISNSGL